MIERAQAQTRVLRPGSLVEEIKARPEAGPPQRPSTRPPVRNRRRMAGFAMVAALL